MTEKEVMERLRSAVEKAGGQRAFAASSGLSPAYVNDVLHGRRALADVICAAIGVQRHTIYVVKYSKAGKP